MQYLRITPINWTILAQLIALIGCSGTADPQQSSTPEQFAQEIPAIAETPKNIPQPDPTTMPDGAGMVPLAAICSTTPAGGIPFSSDTKAVPLGQPAPFLEGPVWLEKEQVLRFTGWDFANSSKDGPNSIIFEWNPSQQNITIWQPAGKFRANGLAVTANGDLILADHGLQAVLKFNGLDFNQVQVLANMVNDRPFNSPNDVAVDQQGNVYMTDPDYQKVARIGQATTSVYRIGVQGDVKVIDSTRMQPNGLTLSLDEKTLYVGASDGLIIAYRLDNNGEVIDKKQFANANGGIDGMTHDCAGNIVVTVHASKSVKVFDPSGKEIASVLFPENVTNVAYGGQDRKTLFVTTAGRLWQLPATIPGWPY